MTNSDGFSKRMRRETRDVHKISDALINAKLAFGECFLCLILLVSGTEWRRSFIFSII